MCAPYTRKVLHFKFDRAPFLPRNYVFGKTPLSDKVEKETGQGSVLYNWNTSGAAALVSMRNEHFLVVRQTGALPVTYGANASKNDQPEDMKHLGADESHAYDYFASVGDPNLERVVQYTAIYQLFRAIVNESKTPANSAENVGTLAKVALSESHTLSGGMQLLVQKMKDALTQLRDGTFCKNAATDDSRSKSLCEDYASQTLVPALKDFHQNFPDVDDITLARFLISPRDTQLALFTAAQSMLPALDAFEKQREAFAGKEDDFNKARQRVDSEAAALTASQAANDSQEVNDEMELSLAKFKEDSAALERSRNELDVEESKLLEEQPPGLVAFQNRRQAFRAAESIGPLFSEVASVGGSRSDTLMQFIEANQSEPDGAIRTPTAVISWDRKSFDVQVGGHNLDSRALRFEESDDTPSLSLVETADGPTLKYNAGLESSVSAHAGQVSRAVEHDGINDTSDLLKIIEQPQDVRARSVSLEIKSPTPSTTRSWSKNEAWSARIGDRVFQDRKPFVENLRSTSEQNECCTFIAEDDASTSYIAEDNPAPPPTKLIFAADDTPSLLEHLGKGRGASKPLVFLNSRNEHVQALALALDADSDVGRFSSIADALSSSKLASGRAEIVCENLVGRRVSIRDWFAGDKQLDFVNVVKQMFVRHEAVSWRNARFRILTKDETKQLLGADWDASKDGVPSVVDVHLDVADDVRGVDFDVVAGSPVDDTGRTENELLEVHERVVGQVPNDGATIGAFFATVKSEVAALPSESFRRLALVVESGAGRTLFSDAGYMEVKQRVD
jgi:hypothetical protein